MYVLRLYAGDVDCVFGIRVLLVVDPGDYIHIRALKTHVHSRVFVFVFVSEGWYICITAHP